MVHVITEDGDIHDFEGDELTSPAQQAILFLQEQDKEEREF